MKIYKFEEADLILLAAHFWTLGYVVSACESVDVEQSQDEIMPYGFASSGEDEQIAFVAECLDVFSRLVPAKNGTVRLSP